MNLDPGRRAVLAPVGTQLPEVGFPALPAACAALLEPAHAARAQAVYDECLVAAFDALVCDRPLERRHADHALRCALARVPDHSGVALAVHAVRAAGILRGYHIGEAGTLVSIDDAWQAVPDAGQPLLRAWVQTRPGPGQRQCGAPARHRDPRHGALWRAIPPAGLRLACEPIACGSFRMIGDPAMNWATPPGSWPRRGPTGPLPTG